MPGRDLTPPAPVAAAPQARPDPTAAVLRVQAAALINGDEKGWLAAVDPGKPKLRALYGGMFSALRGLGISQFVYHSGAPVAGKGGRIMVRTSIAYCFSRKSCPEFAARPGKGPPRIVQALTFKRVGGRYVITTLGRATKSDGLQPTPWERSKLFLARGKRVTVAAARSQRKNLRRVLDLAEKSAIVTDRYAALVRNRQPRYRIYLADEKAWKTWYGGVPEEWVVGLARPLNDTGTDIVLRMSQLGDRWRLAAAIQHEMGHVVTLSGATVRRSAKDRWLSEGIAEYIGWAPKPASASWRRASVRAAFRGKKRPASIVAQPPGPRASDLVVETFYGLGQFAADCLASRYGERRLFVFVRLVLRQDQTYDRAARQSFGKPFTAVDKACVAWITKHI